MRFLISHCLRGVAPAIAGATASVLLVTAPAVSAHAQKFSSKAGAFSFGLPQRWSAEEVGGSARISAPDGSVYILDRDCIRGATAATPLSDSSAKRYAQDTAAALGAVGAPERVISISMDHGQGASFRFKSGDGKTIDVWVGFIGTRTFSLIPERAGQSSQTIGLSSIFQSLTASGAATPPPSPNSGFTASAIRQVSYTRQIAPLLRERCNNCHSEESGSGNLSTATYRGLLAGGTHGSIIEKGSADRSTLFDYLTGVKDQMPKGSAPLTAPQIALLKQWIDQGAENDSSARVRKAPGGINSVSGIASPTNGGAPSGTSKPMETYAGHLATDDEHFSITLYTDQTAKADWQFARTGTASLTGPYTVNAGLYTVSLSVASGSLPNGQRSVKLLMQPAGTDVPGTFSLDGGARYKIIGLQLTEMDNASRRTASASGGTAKPGTSASRSTAANRKRNAAMLRQERKLIKQQQKLVNKALKRKKLK